jgi:hypothetical protein
VPCCGVVWRVDSGWVRDEKSRTRAKSCRDRLFAIRIGLARVFAPIVSVLLVLILILFQLHLDGLTKALIVPEQVCRLPIPSLSALPSPLCAVRCAALHSQQQRADPL